MNYEVGVEVTAVTVYPDRARVTCQGQLTVEAGLHRLLIDELPLTLEPDSVRVQGRGTALVRLLSVDVAQRPYFETPAARVRELEAEIEQLEDEQQALKDEKTGWEANGRYLDGMRQQTEQYARALAWQRTTVTDQEALLTFLQEQDRAMRAALRSLSQRMRDLQRRLDKLRQELKALHSQRPRRRNQVRADMEVVSAGDFTVEVSYVAHKAAWRPLYDMRLEPANGGAASLELTTIAEITQQTGQDWLGVALTVSTARPALNQRLPDLNPWFIDVPRPRMVRAAMSAPAPMAAKMDLEAPEPFTMAAPEMAAETVVADVQSSGTAVSFRVPGGTDVPSDGSPHKTTLAQFSLSPTIDYVAAPKHTDAVYRRAKVVNSSPSPLLPGALNLFVADEYIGRNQLEFTAVNDELELLLGVEDRIQVSREMVRRDVDKKLLRDQRQLRYGFEMKLKNLLEMAVSVTVHDHIPVSRHEQVKVKLEKVSPAPSQHSELNLLEWELALSPNVEQTIRYEFLVESPRELQLMGLP